MLMFGLEMWMSGLLCLILVFSLGTSLALGGTPALPPGEGGVSVSGGGEVQRRVLENGLEVLVLENRAAPLVCSYIWYRAGLRNEPEGQAGITHFLEHMAFKGTERLSGREMDRLVTEKGGYLNGFTSMDYTAYVETLPREALELALDIESDRMRKCLLSAEDLESEKGVVLSEFEGAENDPSFLLRREVMAAQFPGQPYGRTVIGDKGDLRGLTREQVVDYYKRHYAPNNAVLVVVGDVKAEEVFTKAERFFGDIPRGEEPKPRANPGRGATGEKRVRLELPGQTSYLEEVYQVPAVDHPDHVVLEVLQDILSGGRTARLYPALVDAGIASHAGGWDYENPDTTVFALEVALRPGVSHERAEQALEAVIEDLKQTPPTARELQKAKNQTKADFVYASDGVTKLGQQIGYYHLIASYDYLRSFPGRVDAVTAEDISRVVRQYFVRENRTVGWLVADGDGEAEAGGSGSPQELRGYRAEGEAGAPGAGGRSLVTVPVPAGLGEVPPVREIRLGNGLHLIVQENHSAPLAVMEANIMAGPAFDPKGKAGLAAFCAEMLSRGTTKRSWQEMREELEFVAADLGFGVGAQVGTASGRCLKADLRLLLEAAAEQLMVPSFPEEEIEKVRSELIAAQRRRDEDTRSVADKIFFERLYPEGHPLHAPLLGTKESVDSITRDDLAAFHARYYRPENTILAVVGDVDASEVAEMVEQAFAAWERRGEPVFPEMFAVPAPAEPTTVAVLVPNKTQLDILIGFPGISRRDPAYYQADLMNYLLGRGFMSRLNMRIRDDLGLAYYVWSGFYAYWGAGPWLLHMGVNPANREKAVAAAIEELKALQAEAPSEEELTLWKDYVEGTVARQMETFSGIGQNLVVAAFYDLGLYFPYQYPKLLRSITPEQVQEAAKQFLHPEGYLVVIAGPVGSGEGEPAAEPPSTR